MLKVIIELVTSVKDLKGNPALREGSEKGWNTHHKHLYFLIHNFVQHISRKVDFKNGSDKIQTEIMNISLEYTEKTSLIVKQGRI